MRTIHHLIVPIMLLIVSLGPAAAQTDSTFSNKLGIDVSYSGMSFTESAVIGFQLTYTMKKHSVALGPHIFNHDLFIGQSDWARFGVYFTYQYFPIRSNRLFSPYLFYDLNWQYIKATRPVVLVADDGVSTYNARHEVVSNSIAHHFGIGTRCNFYKGFFLHLSAGAGPGSFGDSVIDRSLSENHPDRKDLKHPFSTYETAFMFRLGIAYQVGLDELKKAENCCN